MRIRDEEKITALFEATVSTVNEIGFASSSVAKIAKEAGVSPATIYVYYKNKDELLVSTYVEIKRKMSEAFLRNFDETLPVRDTFKQVWLNMIDFITHYSHYYTYAEQFANSPFSELVDNHEVERYFEPLFTVLQRGIDQNIIKHVHYKLFVAFMFHPITNLANAHIYNNFELTDDHIETAFAMAWDAIKQ